MADEMNIVVAFSANDMLVTQTGRDRLPGTLAVVTSGGRVLAHSAAAH